MPQHQTAATSRTANKRHHSPSPLQILTTRIAVQAMADQGMGINEILVELDHIDPSVVLGAYNDATASTNNTATHSDHNETTTH